MNVNVSALVGKGSKNPRRTNLDALFIGLRVFLEILQQKPIGPVLLVQIKEHSLLEFRFAEADRDAVIMPVETVYQRLNGGLVKMANVGRCLARLLARHCGTLHKH